MKKSVVALSLALAGAQAFALTAGDIAVIAVNTDGDDHFAWVALTDLAAGTVIKFTDSSWQGNAFRATEHLDAAGGGPLSWSSAAAVSAGTVINYLGKTANSWSIGTATGSALNLSNDGDQIFAFQGSIASPAFIDGLQLAHATGIIPAPTVSNSTNTTNVPSTLSIAAGTMRNLGNFDNAYYSGITAGSKASLTAALMTPANWTVSNSELARSNWPSSFNVTSVPEPQSYALALAGLAVAFSLTRRRLG
jgi:hypothetical protein